MAQVIRVDTADGISWHVAQFSTPSTTPKPHIILVPSGEGDCGSFTEAKNDCLATLLAPHFNVTTFDMPGMSRTTYSPSSLEDLTGHKIAGQNVNLLNRLGIERTSVYGSSSGATVAMALLQGWNKRIDRVFVHEVPLELPEGLSYLYKLKADGDNQAILGFCREMSRGMNADNLAAWEALGPEYHSRLDKNYAVWVKYYVGIIEQDGGDWRKEGENLDWKKVSWTIGRNSPPDWFENNVVFGAKRGVEVRKLDCVHFPQVISLDRWRCIFEKVVV